MSNLKVGSKVYIPSINKTGVIQEAQFKGLKKVKLDTGDIHQIADELIVLYTSLSWLIRLIISIFKKRK